MRVPGFALIHRARVVSTVRAGDRDEQGERPATPTAGPWFPCRRTTRRPGGKSPAEPGGARRGEKPWLLIWGDVDELGAALTAPTAHDEVEVETVKLDGTPETLRYVITAVPADYDAGSGAFGGQAEIAIVLGAS